ncbi:MAG: hypothetical protein ACXAC8_06360 [Candidatus Hodarchaeales archaeon]|jgi:hypothetical protein
MENLSELFSEIKVILEKHSKGLDAKTETIGSQAKVKKPAYHLYGSKEVSLFGKKPEKTYIGGVIQQKNYVSFYLMPIYSHPELSENLDQDLKKDLKGKSCFNIRKKTPRTLELIEDVLEKGIKKYEEIKWI